MIALRWALTALMLSSILGAAFAGFGDFGPDHDHLAGLTAGIFMLAALFSGLTLAVIAWFDGGGFRD